MPGEKNHSTTSVKYRVW